MKDFLLIYRSDLSTTQYQLSPEEMQAMMKPWQDWLGSLAAQNKLTDAGSRLKREGKIIRPGNVITDGPFMELKEGVGGYSLIKAESIEEAVELAKGCPIYNMGGSVEVREQLTM